MDVRVCLTFLFSFYAGVANAKQEEEESVEAFLASPTLAVVSLAAVLTIVVVLTMCAKCGCKIEPREEPDIIIAQATPSVHYTSVSSATGQPTTMTEYHSGGEVLATGLRFS